MAFLGNPQNTIEILNKYHITFQKRFGQNFLIDTHVLEKIIAAANITKDDFVIEIGPGIGTLTQYLCEAAGDVVAIEIDKNLLPILTEDTLLAYDNVSVINADILSFDVKALIDEKGKERPVKVVANLPYYITTPILMQLLESNLPLESITVMIQREVADRLKAKPGTKDFGAITLAVQYYAEPYLAANVPQNCFMPRPNVASAVIRLTLHKERPVSVNDSALMFRIVRAAFNQRRKTLVNAINNFPEISLSKEEILSCILDCNLSESIRGEALSLAQFAALSDAIGTRLANQE